MSKKKVLMVYPQVGFSGAFVKHAPIGLLYATSEVVKAGYEVVILDCRLHPENWREVLTQYLDEDTLLVGISVMTGRPILGALEVGRFVKEFFPEVKVVWGGAFPTFHPEYILRDDENCDYVISGYGAKALGSLVQSLDSGEEPTYIPGVHFRTKDGIGFTESDWSCHEQIDFRDIPYQLLDDYSVYGQLDHSKQIFSLYSAMGCPYQCAFCSSPALYRNVEGPKWVPFAVGSVVDHISLAVKEYGADYIYFIDDDSFVDLNHVENIIDEIDKRGVRVGLGFRGARVSEVNKMSDDFIDKLASAGTDILHIGAESGSDRILGLVGKNCTVDDIRACNAKLARNKKIKPFYNFIIGLPTETLDDLKKTGQLMLELVEGNENAIIGIPNKFRPLPGTELFDLAQKEWGFKPPENLVEFSGVEVEGEYQASCFDRKFRKYCDMLIVVSYFIDDKIFKVTSGNTIFYRILRVLSRIYAPIAKFRLKRGFSNILIEKHLFNLSQKLLS
jgi:magnesium-protoporphyrin IX monomethyl ester (oxidative) cyclase